MVDSCATPATTFGFRIILVLTRGSLDSRMF